MSTIPPARTTPAHGARFHAPPSAVSTAVVHACTMLGQPAVATGAAGADEDATVLWPAQGRRLSRDVLAAMVAVAVVSALSSGLAVRFALDDSFDRAATVPAGSTPAPSGAENDARVSHPVAGSHAPSTVEVHVVDGTEQMSGRASLGLRVPAGVNVETTDPRLKVEGSGGERVLSVAQGARGADSEADRQHAQHVPTPFTPWALGP